jgi:DNA-binding NarL/FixJ family response regulator
LVRRPKSSETEIFSVRSLLVIRLTDKAERFMPEISPNPIPKIRVLIADDHPVIRYGLCTILQSEKDIQIVGEAVDGEEACALCRKHGPDVLVLDLRMPKKGGLQVLSELTACGVSKPHTLVITAHLTEQDIHQALNAGAYAFLLKGANPEQVREAVRKVAKGETFLPPEVELKLTESKGYGQLSKRENQVLQCLVLGRTNKEIAQALSIGEGTVKHHVKSILCKLNATGRADAVGIAVRRGLLSVC